MNLFIIQIGFTKNNFYSYVHGNIPVMANNFASNKIYKNFVMKSIFTNQKYTGVDVKKGPCVDIVYDGLNLDIQDKFDLSISCECFEHNPFYLENFKKMIELTKNDGVVVFTCASIFRKEHGTTRTTPADSPGSMEKWDYYKNLFKKDFEKK